LRNGHGDGRFADTTGAYEGDESMLRQLFGQCADGGIPSEHPVTQRRQIVGLPSYDRRSRRPLYLRARALDSGDKTIAAPV
jgi:hypothetical protein